jgi:hypothetical protein
MVIEIGQNLKTLIGLALVLGVIAWLGWLSFR